MNKYNPEDYSITVNQEMIDGEQYFVGRVAEFPTLISYESTYDEAYQYCVEMIKCSMRIAADNHINLPIQNKYKSKVSE